MPKEEGGLIHGWGAPTFGGALPSPSSCSSSAPEGKVCIEWGGLYNSQETTPPQPSNEGGGFGVWEGSRVQSRRSFRAAMGGWLGMMGPGVALRPTERATGRGPPRPPPSGAEPPALSQDPPGGGMSRGGGGARPGRLRYAALPPSLPPAVPLTVAAARSGPTGETKFHTRARAPARRPTSRHTSTRAPAHTLARTLPHAQGSSSHHTLGRGGARRHNARRRGDAPWRDGGTHALTHGRERAARTDQPIHPLAPVA